MDSRKGEHFEYRGGRGGREDQYCAQQGQPDQNNRSNETVKIKPDLDYNYYTFFCQYRKRSILARFGVKI